MSKPSEVALAALRRILEATNANVKQLATESGLTVSQLLVLRLLKARGSLLTSDIARAVNLRLATVSILLDKLQEQQLIERRRGESDRRQVLIHLTALGAEVLAQAPDLLQVKFHERFERLPDWEQASLVAALLRVVNLMEAEHIDASPVLDIGKVTELPATD